MFCSGRNLLYFARNGIWEESFGLFYLQNSSRGKILGITCWKELRELTGDSPNIFKESNIECYVERPNTTLAMEWKIHNDT